MRSKDYMKYFYGPYARNDEYIMGPIYNALGITQNRDHSRPNFFNNFSGILTERYFKICQDGSIKDHTNYEEFLKIQQEIVDQPSWIIDGNNSTSFETRWQKADLVIYFNFPRWI